MNVGKVSKPKHPTLSWLPVRYIRDIVLGRKSVESWLHQAPEFGFSYVELYYMFVPNTTQLRKIHTKLNELGLGVSMLTCAPDFTNPEQKIRAQQIEEMKEKVDAAHYLGASAVRVTTGMSYPDVSIDEGITWACECFLELAEYAEPKGVKLCLENHYKDRMWDKIDFAVKVETFMQIYDRLRSTPIMVNFDTSHPMVMDFDGVALLNYVKDKVYNVHAGDRVRGQRPHTVISEGMVDFDSTFAILKSVGYNRFITVEDGSPKGDEGLRKGILFLKTKISKHWG